MNIPEHRSRGGWPTVATSIIKGIFLLENIDQVATERKKMIHGTSSPSCLPLRSVASGLNGEDSLSSLRTRRSFLSLPLCHFWASSVSGRWKELSVRYFFPYAASSIKNLFAADSFTYTKQRSLTAFMSRPNRCLKTGITLQPIRLLVPEELFCTVIREPVR